MILDLFAGAGGWSEGLRSLGLAEVGIEWDKSACATRAAAGHLTICADVAAYPTAPFVGKVEGLIASPPCQAWSMAGQRKGERDRARCHELASDFALGYDADPLYGAGSLPDDWEDERSHLVAQPVRWVHALRPEWVALEQVPPVIGLWRHFAEIFRGWGYRAWAGVLNAADYGVPQTRERAILVAHRSRGVQPPARTHCDGGSQDGLFGPGLLPWVPMAEALGWGMTERPSFTATSGGTATGGAEVFGRHAREAMVDVRIGGGWKDREHARGPQDERRQRVLGGSALVGAHEQGALVEGAVKLHTNRAAAKVEWGHERPATTIVSAFGAGKVAPPGHHTTSTYEAEESVAITIEEAAILQSFRPDYPWQGSKTKKFEQIGNAIPPVLAASILAALLEIQP